MLLIHIFERPLGLLCVTFAGCIEKPTGNSLRVTPGNVLLRWKSKVSWEHIRPSRELLTSCQRCFVVRQELRARLRFNGLTMTRPTSLWLPSLSERYGDSICPKYFKDFLNCTTKTRRALYITVTSMSYGIGKNSNLAIDKVNRRNEELYRLLLLATVLFWK